jgi:transposase
MKYIPNKNIYFPIGTVLAVNQLYEFLVLPSVFGKHKNNGIDINNLLKALVSYKLTDNWFHRTTVYIPDAIRVQ